MMSRLLFFCSFIVLAFIWIYIAVHFSQLPEIVPTHFGMDGKADGFGSKNMLWFLAVVSTVLFLLLYYIIKNPDSPLLSIPDALRKNTVLTAMFLGIMNVLTMSIFADIVYESVQVALGHQMEISQTSLILIGLIFVALVAFSLAANKQASNKL